MGDAVAERRRANSRRVLGQHVIWAVTAVGLVVAVWTTASSTGAEVFLAPWAVALAWGAAGTTWPLTVGRIEPEAEPPRGRPHPRSRRARGVRPRRPTPPPWRWPVVLAYAAPVVASVGLAPVVLDAEDAGVVVAIQPLALLLGWLCGLCLSLVVLAMRIVVTGVLGFGRPLVTGELEGEPVGRAWFVGPFVATASLLALPLVLLGPLAYSSPYRRDVLPLLGVLRDGVHVEHPVLLALSQVATWCVVVGIAAGFVVHRAVGARR